MSESNKKIEEQKFENNPSTGTPQTSGEVNDFESFLKAWAINPNQSNRRVSQFTIEACVDENGNHRGGSKCQCFEGIGRIM